MINSKVIPKLSPSQECLLRQLTANIHQQDVADRLARRQGRSQIGRVASPPSAPAQMHVDAPVRVLRDIVGTSYRAGQRGTILALHNANFSAVCSTKAVKAAKVVAEVLIDSTQYADIVSLADLELLAHRGS